MKPKRYPIPLRQRLRLQFGGLWQRTYPNLPTVRDIVFATLFVLGLLLVMGLLDDKAHAVAMADKRAEKAERSLIECLNGIAIWRAADGSEVGCMPAQYNH